MNGSCAQGLLSSAQLRSLRPLADQGEPKRQRNPSPQRDKGRSLYPSEEPAHDGNPAPHGIALTGDVGRRFADRADVPAEALDRIAAGKREAAGQKCNSDQLPEHHRSLVSP